MPLGNIFLGTSKRRPQEVPLCWPLEAAATFNNSQASYSTCGLPPQLTISPTPVLRSPEEGLLGQHPPPTTPLPTLAPSAFPFQMLAAVSGFSQPAGTPEPVCEAR